MEVLRRSSVFAAEVMEVFDRSPTDKELVSQAKVLCRDYIHSRLLWAGIGWSKPEHSAPMPGGRLAEVSSVLLRLGDELEYIRPNVYRNIARQLNISLHSETVVTDAFLAVAAQIFTADEQHGSPVNMDGCRKQSVGHGGQSVSGSVGCAESRDRTGTFSATDQCSDASPALVLGNV
nr:bcl-2-related ovarian killer protein isoform X2 [Chrysemys picta bellii]